MLYSVWSGLRIIDLFDAYNLVDITETSQDHTFATLTTVSFLPPIEEKLL